VAAVSDVAKELGEARESQPTQPRVLIVDESELLSEEIRDALQRNGVHVVGIATTANAAVTALSSGIADAVILCMRTQTASRPSPSAATPPAHMRPPAAAVFAPGLTTRERQVLRLLVTGASNKEMAKRLAIRSNTVRTHVQNLLAKLRVHTRLEAVTLAIRGGLDDTEETLAIGSANS
jgi:DNA-binding NarL/FixJ family response regulator